MGILVLDDMLAPLSFFWGSISVLSIICHLHIAHNITLFALHEHCLYFFRDHFNYQEKKKKGYAKRGGGSKHGLLWEMCKWWMPFSEKKDFLFWKSFFTRSRFQHFKQKKKEEYWNVNFTACNIYLTIEDNIQARLTFVTLWNLCIMINLSNKIAIWSCMDLL